ncbi:MAG: AI-2E family transporter [Rhodothermaceae bacterium]|nr:AI-2E family transporter [Rhodothermaceae bacterium]
MSTKNTYPLYVKATVILAGIIMTIYGMIVAKGILVPLLLSAFFAVLLIPPCDVLESKRIPRSIAALLGMIFITFILSSIGFMFTNEIRSFGDELPDIQERIEQLGDDTHASLIRYSPEFIKPRVEQMDFGLANLVDIDLSSATLRVLSTVGGLTMYFLIPIFIYLFLIYRDFIGVFMVKAFSGGDKDRIRSLVEKVKNVVQSYITGLFFVICIIAVLNVILLLSLGIKHAVLFGVFSALLNVIPFLGPILGSILPAAYSLLTMDSLWIPFAVILGSYIIQLFEGNLITPVIIGNKVSMNPLSTIVALLVGGQIWGLVGMILFIPALAILKILFDEVEGLKPYGFLLGSVDKKYKTAPPVKYKDQDAGPASSA